MVAIKRSPADIEFSRCIRQAAGNKCEHCGLEDGKMECAHIYGRRNKAVRWEPMNALCLCFTCHLHFTGNPLDFEVWLRGYLGQGHIDLLNEKRRPQFKTTKQVLKEIAKFYREQLKTLQPGDKLVSYY